MIRSLHSIFRWLGSPGTVSTRARTEELSRRTIVTSALGVGAAVAAAEAIGQPAAAANDSVALTQATTIEQGAVAPAVVLLTDAVTIAVDASLGNDFRATLAASRTMGNPANSADGQQIIFQITQGAGGSSSITWDTNYEFSTGIPEPALSTTTGQTDLLGFVYNATKGKWLLAAFVNGFG